MSRARDIRQHEPASLAQNGRAVRIHRRGHPEVALALQAGLRYSFGRTPQAAVLLPDVRVSRVHGHLEVFEGRWTFTDLGSVNGSFLFRVEDLLHSELTGSNLPCVQLEAGQRGRVRPGDGVLLGCRDAWIEVLPSPPPGAVSSLARVNPPQIMALIGVESVGSARTPDIRWTEQPELPPLRALRDAS